MGDFLIGLVIGSILAFIIFALSSANKIVIDRCDYEKINEDLEKQIPKKPIITALNVYCPNCNHDLGKERAKREALSNFKYFGYCSTCGCALDWSDTE